MCKAVEWNINTSNKYDIDYRKIVIDVKHFKRLRIVILGKLLIDLPNILINDVKKDVYNKQYKL